MIPNRPIEKLHDLFGPGGRGLLVSSPHFSIENLPDGRQQAHLRPEIMAKARKKHIPLPGPDLACAPYGDFWPSYYHAPTGSWKKFCYRTIEFDFDQVSLAVSNRTGEPEWFVVIGAYVPELFAAFGASPPPAGVSLHIKLTLQMFRDVVWDGFGHQTVVSPNEDSSIPFVDEICYAALT